MPRKASITPNRHLHTTIPAELAMKLDLFLFSELEGRIPAGSHQAFFTKCIREFFDHRNLDLAPYVGTLPEEHVVRGSPATIFVLKSKLEKI